MGPCLILPPENENCLASKRLWTVVLFFGDARGFFPGTSTCSCNPREPYQKEKYTTASNDIIQINDEIPKTFCLFTLQKCFRDFIFLPPTWMHLLPLTSQDPIKLEVKVHAVTCAGLVVEGGWWLTILPNSPIKGISMKGRGSGKLPAWLGPPFPVTNHSEKQSKLHLNWDIPQYLLSAVFRGSSPPYNGPVLWAPPPRLTQRRWKHDTQPYVSRNEGGCSWASPQHFMVLLSPTSWHFTDFMMVWTEDTTPTLPNSRKLPGPDTYTNVKVHQSQDDHSTPSTAQIHGENHLPENRRSGGTSRFPRGYCLKVFV